MDKDAEFGKDIDLDVEKYVDVSENYVDKDVDGGVEKFMYVDNNIQKFMSITSSTVATTT